MKRTSHPKSAILFCFAGCLLSAQPVLAADCQPDRFIKNTVGECFATNGSVSVDPLGGGITGPCTCPRDCDRNTQVVDSGIWQLTVPGWQGGPLPGGDGFTTQDAGGNCLFNTLPSTNAAVPPKRQGPGAP